MCVYIFGNIVFHAGEKKTEFWLFLCTTQKKKKKISKCSFMWPREKKALFWLKLRFFSHFVSIVFLCGTNPLPSCCSCADVWAAENIPAALWHFQQQQDELYEWKKVDKCEQWSHRPELQTLQQAGVNLTPSVSSTSSSVRSLTSFKTEYLEIQIFLHWIYFKLKKKISARKTNSNWDGTDIFPYFCQYIWKYSVLKKNEM